MSQTGKEVLVVEDNLALASVVRFNLERAGYQVTLARDGQEGWQQAQARRFDLIITDQQMPIMSGCELCEKLRQTQAYDGVPIIMLTAKGLELDLPRLKEQYGVTASFSKPFSPKQLIGAVTKYLPEASETPHQP